MKELLEELKEVNKESKEYLESFLREDSQASKHFPTIYEYDNVVATLDDLFEVRIYDLALYNLTKKLLEKYG